MFLLGQLKHESIREAFAVTLDGLIQNLRFHTIEHGNIAVKYHLNTAKG